jgi:hypothetical protein
VFLFLLIVVGFVLPSVGFEKNHLRLYADIAFSVVLVVGAAIAWEDRKLFVLTSLAVSVAIAVCWLAWRTPTKSLVLWSASNQTDTRSLEWSCEAVSPMAEPCNSTATSHCGICGRWFCAVHAEAETWHVCVLETGEEGGEA